MHLCPSKIFQNIFSFTRHIISQLGGTTKKARQAFVEIPSIEIMHKFGQGTICIFILSIQVFFSGGSPISKHESSGGECDSDEKNPDIIPQPVDVEDSSDYCRKRQPISTIETSPSRSLLHASGNSGGGYIGYCTLRNGMPLHEIPPQKQMVSR